MTEIGLILQCQGESPVLNEWNTMIQEVQSDCGQLMRLILEMMNRDNEVQMNDLTQEIENE